MSHRLQTRQSTYPDHCTANLNVFHLLLMKMEHLNTLQLNLLRNDNLQLRNLSSQKMGQVRSDKRKIDIINEEKVLTLSFLSEDCVKIWGRVRSLMGGSRLSISRRQEATAGISFKVCSSQIFASASLWLLICFRSIFITTSTMIGYEYCRVLPVSSVCCVKFWT